MISELKNMGEGDLVLLIVSVERYHKAVPDIIRFFVMEKDKGGIIISANRSYERLKNTLKNNKVNIDRLFFIDVVSKTVGLDVKKSDRCLYIDNPRNLVDLSVSVPKLISNMKEGNPFLVFDSVSGLLLYNKPKTIEKFTHSFCSKMRSWDLTGVMLVVEGGLEDDVVTTISGFCDRTIKIH